MSIRAIAQDLYKAQQKVDILEKELLTCENSEKQTIEIELKVAHKELEMMRKILEGEKSSGSFKKRFTGFGYK